MTWDDLAKRILEMTDGDREKTVQYVEPYQDGAEIFAVDLHEASTYFLDTEAVVRITKGEFFLQ